MKKKIVLLVLVSFIALLAISFIIRNHLISSKDPEYAIVTGEFSYDTDKPNEVIGAADYAFVAYIDELKDTSYEYTYAKEGSITRKFDDPYTNYNITVLRNIKGNLKIDESIPITKRGGLKKNKTIQLFEDDELPVEDKIYIITAYANENGA